MLDVFMTYYSIHIYILIISSSLFIVMSVTTHYRTSKSEGLEYST